MDNYWINAAESLKSAIQDRAVAEFLENHDSAEIAAVASDAFQKLPDNERASVIATLAAQVRS